MIESLPPGLTVALAVLVSWKAVRDFRSIERQQRLRDVLGHAEPQPLIARPNPYDWRKGGE